MRDSRCFVQFIHPGGEHQPDHDGCKHWNLTDHKRKFLMTRGRYRWCANGPDLGGEIVFWGEWEPESRLTRIANPMHHGPRFVYEPFFVKPNTNAWRQNTDPFVFGEQFHYTGCLQHTKRGPTQLRYLSAGSIILFGSCIDKSTFVLDTAFVVAGHVDHSAHTYRQVLTPRTSHTYQVVTVGPWYSKRRPPGQSYRLYSGASPNLPVDGMFSFFPCLPRKTGGNGFARPQIVIPDRITQTLNQGKKISRDLTTVQIKALWENIAKQVLTARLALGTFAQLPDHAAPCPKVTRTNAPVLATRGAYSVAPKNAGRRKC